MQSETTRLTTISQQLKQERRDRVQVLTDGLLVHDTGTLLKEANELAVITAGDPADQTNQKHYNYDSSCNWLRYPTPAG